MASWDGDGGLFGKTYGDGLCKYAMDEMGQFPEIDDIEMDADWYQHIGGVILATEFGDVHLYDDLNPAARAYIVLAEDEQAVVAEVMVPYTDEDTGEFIGQEEAARRAWTELKDAVEWRAV